MATGAVFPAFIRATYQETSDGLPAFERAMQTSVNRARKAAEVSMEDLQREISNALAGGKADFGLGDLRAASTAADARAKAARTVANALAASAAAEADYSAATQVSIAAARRLADEEENAARMALLNVTAVERMADAARRSSIDVTALAGSNVVGLRSANAHRQAQMMLGQQMQDAAIQMQLGNALDNFDRAVRLFDIDREMAFFRAITGEEEAATVLIKVIQIRRYQHAEQFNPRDHVHKAAVLTCVNAVSSTTHPMLREFQLKFDFKKPRIDLNLPLSNFGVNGGENFAIQPVESLGMLYTRPGKNERDPYDDVLENLAQEASFRNIKRMVSTLANERNRLLYASDSAPPTSRATMQSIRLRERRAQTMLALAIMIFQTRDHLPTVRQAVLTFLTIISKLPEGETT